MTAMRVTEPDFFDADLVRFARAIARSMVPSDDADDVAQDALAACWRVRDRIQSGGLRAYVGRAVRNTAKNYYRRRASIARRTRAHGNLRLVDAPVDDRLIALDTLSEAAEILEALSPTSREVLTLAYLNGDDVPTCYELGAVLGCTPVAARQRLTRARREIAAVRRRSERGTA